MALAAHSMTITVSADDISYSTCSGLNDVATDIMNELLDITDFDDGSARVRLAGIFDSGVDFSGFYESADTGQALVRSSHASGATIYVKCAWNGSAGHKFTCKVESYNISASVDGPVTFSATLKGTGAIATF